MTAIPRDFNVIGPTTKNGILVQSKNRLILLESLIGLGVGFLGGLVGLVLGSIRMPAMISILKMEPKVAVGTNLAGCFCNGNIWVDRTFHKWQYRLSCSCRNGLRYHDWWVLGARYTNRFSDRNLKRIIGLVLIAVAITMFLRAFQLY